MTLTPTGFPITQPEMAESLVQRFLATDQPGVIKLPSERELAKEYGVSRAFAREVLAGLAQQGYIKTVPGRGAFIRKAEMTDIARGLRVAYGQHAVTPRMLMEARHSLETQTAALAAERATPAYITSLASTLDAFDVATDLVSRARSDIAFHSLLAKASQNPVLEMMFGAISSLTFELMLRSLGDAKTVALGAPLHRKIFAAVEARDPEGASEAMSRHLHVANSTFGPDIDTSLNIVADDTIKRILGPTYSLEEIVTDALREFQTNLNQGHDHEDH
jgi:GntR family transcriptional repressor for pyruvate dehydrogenase complex